MKRRGKKRVVFWKAWRISKPKIDVYKALTTLELGGSWTTFSVSEV